MTTPSPNRDYAPLFLIWIGGFILGTVATSALFILAGAAP